MYTVPSSVPRVPDETNGPFLSQSGAVKKEWDQEGKHHASETIKVGPYKIGIPDLVRDVFGVEYEPPELPGVVVVSDTKARDSVAYESVREAAWACGVTRGQMREYMRSGETFCKRYAVVTPRGGEGEKWVSIRDVLGMRHKYWDPVSERVVLPAERRRCAWRRRDHDE